jgi:hypothetical protein
MSIPHIDPRTLDDLAATIGLSIPQTNKAKLSSLLALTRDAVLRRADTLPADATPALLFDAY